MDNFDIMAIAMSVLAIVVPAVAGFGFNKIRKLVESTETKLDDKVYNAVRKALNEAGEIQTPEDQ